MTMFYNAPPSLELRPLGKTGLQVTGLCVGTAPLGDMPDTFAYSVGEEQALATLRAVFAGPIKFVDTAASYGDGESERRIGIVLREIGGLPQGFVLASKADRDLKTGDFSGDQMRRSVERSLRLLGLEQIQLMYLHDPEHISFEQAIAPGGPVEVLQKCKEEGLIAHLGVAGGPLDLMGRFVETDLFEVAISHNRYTLLNFSADGFWDLCGRHGVATVNAAPYGSGILAKGPLAYPRYEYQPASERDIEKAKRIQEICSRYNVPLAAAALQVSLRDQRITATIVGLTRPERIQQTIELAQHPIPEELWAELANLKNMP
jgi:D-threo-aldose 1-dehydrogenase